MAISTPTSLGSSSPAVSGTSHTHTTTALIPSNALLIVHASWGADPVRTATMSCGGGIGAMALDVGPANATPVGTFVLSTAVFSVQIPAGLASSTVLTLTTSGSAFGAMISAVYVTGAATTTPKDVSDSSLGSGTGWDTTATSTTVDETLVIGGAAADGSRTSTATGGATELFDFTNTNAWTHTTTYKLLASAESTSLTGTWSGTEPWTAAFVAYKAAEEEAAVGNRLRRFL